MGSTLVSTFVTVTKLFLSLMKWPTILFFATILVFYLDCMFWYYLRYRKGDRVQRGSVRRPVKRTALLRIFVDAPKQYVDDMYNRKPDFFHPQGMVVFTGRQGNGKSAALFSTPWICMTSIPWPSASVIQSIVTRIKHLPIGASLPTIRTLTKG